MPYTISALNQMEHPAFVAALGGVFEHTPAIATQAWYQRPFTDVEHLHRAMVEIMHHLNSDATLALIRAHPDLAGNAVMTEASVAEQAGAGFARLPPTVVERFHQLNQSYKTKFGFPFVIAVKHHTPATILDMFEQRLAHSPQQELKQALAEIAQIARFRLLSLVLDE